MSKFETIINGIGMGGDPEHSFRLHSKHIPAKGGMGRNSIAYENEGRPIRCEKQKRRLSR